MAKKVIRLKKAKKEVVTVFDRIVFFVFCISAAISVGLLLAYLASAVNG